MKASKLLFIITTIISVCTANGQELQDTLKMNFGESSSLQIYINSRNDYDVLRSYDLDSLVDQMTTELEYQKEEIKSIDIDSDQSQSKTVIIWTKDTKKIIIGGDHHSSADNKKRKFPYTKSYIQMDFGINNYFSNGTLSADTDQPLAVRNWGSWYVGLNTTLDTKFSRRFNLESSLGISWYNFKFQNDDTRITKTDDEIVFSLDDSGRNNTKSKLTIAYINAQLVPIIKVGKNKRYGIGLGGYLGYRIDSYTKNVFEIDGDKDKIRDRDNLFLNRWRYGARFQFGVNGHSFFINYDLNELFQTDKGPELHGISFGVII